MTQIQGDKRIRFEGFEFDPSTGELYKDGRGVRLQGQPARLLTLLVTRPGEVVTRLEIQQALWPDGRFVEFEHAINTAVKKVREALDDDPDDPKFVQTIPKVGYRFTASVLTARETETGVTPAAESGGQTAPAQPPADEQFSIPYPALSRFLFLFIQAGYLVLYCVALLYIPELDGALSAAGFVPVAITFPMLIVAAMCGIAVRLYLITEVAWRHPAAGRNYIRLFPFVFVLDALWAASPILAAPALGIGIALAGSAGMAYLPFAQRTLIRGIYKPHG